MLVLLFFFFNDTATTEIYTYCHTLSLHDALPIWIAQHIAAAPYGLDIIVAATGEGKLLAKLANEDVDDLQLRLVHAAIEMVEEHFLRERGALAEREKLQHRIFLAGQMHPGTVDLNRLGIEVHGRSEEHTSELQSLMRISYAVFCLKKKK